MNGRLPPLLEAAVAAVAGWSVDGRSPRELVAEQRPAGLDASARTEIAAVVYGTIRDQRRLEWSLGEAYESCAGIARAAALVLAHCVATDRLSPPEAMARWRVFAPPPLAFATAQEIERRLAAVTAEQQRFALQHSLPDWLTARLFAEFGADTGRIVAALGADAPRAIRANRLKVADRGVLARELAEAGVSTTFGALAPDCLLVAGDDSLFDLAQYTAGAFEQQDEGSQLVAAAVAPPPRGRVLDACAGSGGKTLAIAAMLRGAGTVLAVDVHAPRLAALRERARRAGAHNVQARTVEESAWGDEVSSFAATADRILLDVPCTGSGSWRRRPEARWQLQPTDEVQLCAMQRGLLDRAAAALRPGARVVYATCSLFRSENEAQVEAALARHPGLELVRPAEVLGGAAAAPVVAAGGRWIALRPDVHGTDGFFAAILRRRRSQ